MGFDLLDVLGAHLAGVSRRAEGAIAHVAPGAARDLGQLRGIEGAHRAPIEFAQRGKRDMVDVHVESHADGIGRDHVVDLARLEERNLGVARARAQGAQHHRSPAALAAHQLGDGIELIDRKCHDGGTRLEPA